MNNWIKFSLQEKIHSKYWKVNQLSLVRVIIDPREIPTTVFFLIDIIYKCILFILISKGKYNSHPSTNKLTFAIDMITVLDNYSKCSQKITQNK